MRIGPYSLATDLAVAPMAGVTDRPFRQLCKRLGAGYAVSEMVASNPKLRHTEKSLRRIDHRGEFAPIAVQIRLVPTVAYGVSSAGEPPLLEGLSEAVSRLVSHRRVHRGFLKRAGGIPPNQQKNRKPAAAAARG